MNKEIIFRDVPDKREFKHTTSLKFKEDLLNIFKDIGTDYTLLEVGTAYGHTTRILSFIFKHVVTMDLHAEPNLRIAQEINHDRDNITYIQKDVYTPWDDLQLPNYQVCLIDCGHDYNHVMSDIGNCIKFGDESQYMIFDDYGHPDTGVKKAITDLCNTNSNFNIVEYIGEPVGSDCRPGLILTDWEGVICKYEIK